MSRSLSRVLAGMFALALGCLFISQMTACETVKGAGTDIHNAGQSTQDAIDGKK